MLNKIISLKIFLSYRSLKIRFFDKLFILEFHSFSINYPRLRYLCDSFLSSLH